MAALLGLSAGAVAWPALRGVVLVADLGALLVLLLDVLTTPRPKTFRLRRELPERVRLSTPFERALLVQGPRPGIEVEVHESFPAAFEELAPGADEPGHTAPDPGSVPQRGRLDASGRLELTRRYRSHLRGRFAFGDLRLRVRGRLGLFERQERFAGQQPLDVEPALLQLGATLRLAASERWQDLGVRTLRRRGGLSEFESLREYVPGDEVRLVDWKAFARRGKPMVRSYQVERGQELVLLIDCGRRMRAPTSAGVRRGWTKLDWALDAALEIAAVALSKGDRVGAAAYERSFLAYVAPGKGSRALTRLSSALFALQPSESDADLARALQELAVRHRRRATVIVVSDVADPLSLEEQRAALAAASRRHRLIFAALDDPALRAVVDGPDEDPAVRAAALELAVERARALRRLASSGARVLDALPAEAAAPMLAAWLDERRSG